MKFPPLLAPKLFYFFWFMALGVYGPFVTLYYRDQGLDLAQIGWLLALPGATQIIAGPLWGLFADALRLHRILLPIVVTGYVIFATLVGWFNTFEPIFVLALISAIFSVPVAPLSDSATLALLGEQRERYGAQRVWGAVGWGLSSVVSGMIVEQLGLPVIFWLCPLMGLFAALSAIALPGVALAAPNVFDAAKSLVRDLRWARFLISAWLVGCASSLMHGFLTIYLADLGATNTQIGFAYTLASISELPVMGLSAIALRRWGTKPLLFCAGLAYAIRLLIYVIAPDPTVALATQLLHGFCFAALWTAGVNEAQRLAPVGLAATAQSLFGAAVFGMAAIVANILGGIIYQEFGYAVLFSAAAGLALIGAIGFLIPIPEPRQMISEQHSS
ncbi:MAG: hypothetical protein Fur005_34290 [Roseiflexaceae bacterium]